MWCISEIFSSNSDKARLITAVISVVAAVLVVYLTHAFAYRRSRMELRAKKMEELYEAITDFANTGWSHMNELTGPHDQGLVTITDYNEAHRKAEMLASIYAADLLGDINEMNVLVIATQEGDNKDIANFKEKLHTFVEAKSNIQKKVAIKGRKFV